MSARDGWRQPRICRHGQRSGMLLPSVALNAQTFPSLERNCSVKPPMKLSRRLATAVAVVALAAAMPFASTADDRADGKPYTQKIDGDVSFQLVPIPAGKFMMGSPDGEKKRKAD